MSAIKERPILFSAPMVRAILAGTKTQTRRIIKGMALEWLRPSGFTPEFTAAPENGLCPYGKPGDVLWVRETFRRDIDRYHARNLVVYRADDAVSNAATDAAFEFPDVDWRPSTHMPRWASRLSLRIKSVRVERLQAISEADAWAEGCMRGDPDDAGGWFPADEPDPSGIGERGWDCARDWFADLWESINGHDSWEANPWVWAIEFKRVTP